MPQRRTVALVLAAVATFAACGSSDDAGTGTGSPTDGGAVVAVGPAPVPGDDAGSLGGAMEVAAAAPGQATGAACAIDRQTLETAIEAYELLNGSRPTSEQELVDAQMIRELSANFDVSADGALVTASGSACP